jgi:large subunit ribosomal protein L10
MPTKAPADSAQVQRKSAVIDDITERLRSAEASVLTEYRGLTVTDLATLRAALRPASTDYKVYKNTLARRAAADAGLTELAEWLEGPVAIAFVRPEGDAVTAAKALRDFAKGNPNLVVKGGMLGPRMLSVADVEALADVPPRDVLLARLAGGFQAPLVKAAGLFQAFTRNFAYGLKAYIDIRPEDGSAPEAPTEESAPGTPASAGSDAVESDHGNEDAPASASDAPAEAQAEPDAPVAEAEPVETENEATTGEAN